MTVMNLKDCRLNTFWIRISYLILQPAEFCHTCSYWRAVFRVCLQYNPVTIVPVLTILNVLKKKLTHDIMKMHIGVFVSSSLLNVLTIPPGLRYIRMYYDGSKLYIYFIKPCTCSSVCLDYCLYFCQGLFEIVNACKHAWKASKASFCFFSSLARYYNRFIHKHKIYCEWMVFG